MSEKIIEIMEYVKEIEDKINLIQKESKYILIFRYSFSSFNNSKDYRVSSKDKNNNIFTIDARYSDMKLQCCFDADESEKGNFDELLVSVENNFILDIIVKDGSEEDQKLKEVFDRFLSKIISKIPSYYNRLVWHKNNTFVPIEPEDKEIRFSLKPMFDSISKDDFYQFLTLRKDWLDIPMAQREITTDLYILNGFLTYLLHSLMMDVVSNMSILKIKKEIKNCSRIIFETATGCEERLVNYDGYFRVEHYNPSALSYCPVCGEFEDHWFYDKESNTEKYSCGDFRKISLKYSCGDFRKISLIRAAYMIRRYKKHGYTNYYILDKEEESYASTSK